MFKKFRKFNEEQKQKDIELNELLQEKTFTLEKNDTLAIIIAALTTIAPMAILFFAVVMGIMWFFFGG